MTPRILIAALALTAAPALADPIAPLAPPPRFDSNAVPIQPYRPEPPQRIERPRPPVIIVPGRPAILPPGSSVIVVPPPPPESLTKTQAAEPPPADLEELLGNGLDSIMQDALRELQPGLEGLAESLGGLENRFGPALQDLGTLVDDIRNYEAPTRLPNGDILIRRRADAPPPPPLGDALEDMTRPPGSTPAPDGTAPRVPDLPAPEDQPALANPMPVIDL